MIKAWVIRYLLVDAGAGMPRRKVLISPPYDSATPLEREQEAGIQRPLWAYGRLASRGDTGREAIGSELALTGRNLLTR